MIYAESKQTRPNVTIELTPYEQDMLRTILGHVNHCSGSDPDRANTQRFSSVLWDKLIATEGSTLLFSVTKGMDL